MKAIILTPQEAQEVRSPTVDPRPVGDIFILSPAMVNDTVCGEFLATLPQREVALPSEGEE